MAPPVRFHRRSRADCSWRKWGGPETLYCSQSHPHGILAVHSVPTTTQTEQAGVHRRLYAPLRCSGLREAFCFGWFRTMDEVRVFLLLEIERQCSYIVKAKSDLDSADKALRSAAFTAKDKISMDTTNTLASVMDSAKQAHFGVDQARFEISYAQQALLVAAGVRGQDDRCEIRDS
jgi:hypothetical protein